MRILVAGDWHSEIHEEPVHNAFIRLGHFVARFPWAPYFTGSLAGKIQNKFLLGPVIDRINRDFLAKVEAVGPDLVFIYRGTHIRPGTLGKIKRRFPETILVGYDNDDPFSTKHPFWLWRHFVRSLKRYDAVFAYRLHNIEDFQKHGARKVGLLRSWYVPEQNHPVSLDENDRVRYGTDVVFIGHYEDDGRIRYIEELARRGINFRFFGHGKEWNPVLEKSPLLRHLVPVRPVWGEEYNKAIAAAKIALCFLSKLNRDTYTRRCFEIPAAGALLLSEYSDDLNSLFPKGVQADYFRSATEMMERIGYYLLHEDERKRVAGAGQASVAANGHDVVSRMRYALEFACAGIPGMPRVPLKNRQGGIRH